MRSSKKDTAPAQSEPQSDSQEIVPEVMATPSTFSRDELSEISTFDDALRLAGMTYGTVVTADEEIGDGFKVATEDDKRRLCGVPLMFLEWAIRDGDFGAYVSIRAVAQTETGITKWILNDGSTGIAEDLVSFQKKTGRTGGLFVRQGLRVSDYWIDAETGVPLTKKEYGEYIARGERTAKASTFYLDTSA